MQNLIFLNVDKLKVKMHMATKSMLVDFTAAIWPCNI